MLKTMVINDFVRLFNNCYLYANLTIFKPTWFSRDSNASSLLSHPENDPIRVQDEFNDFAISNYLRALNLYPGPNFPGGTSNAKVEEPAPKKYYMLPIIKDFSVKVSFDRLALLSLLDRYQNRYRLFERVSFRFVKISALCLTPFFSNAEFF